VIHILLPAYNEEIALRTLVPKIHAALSTNAERYRIVIVNDGSTDGSKTVIAQLSKDYPITLLNHPTNLGLGQTMIDGLHKINSNSDPDDIIVTLDCDDTHEPHYLLSAFQKLREGFDVVILSRFQPGGEEKGLSLKRKILSRGACLFLKTFFPIRGVKDYSCGFRVFRASALHLAHNVFKDKFIQLQHLGFVVSCEILVKFRMLGCRISEVPFTLRYDQKPGLSKNQVMKTIVGYFALVRRFAGKKVQPSS